MNTHEHTNDTSVSVILLRLQHKEVLIPKAMVADVLSWKDELFSDEKTQENWRLGKYHWYDESVPFICFESLIESRFVREEMQKPKVVVVRSFKEGHEENHYALLCKGFPKPLILSEQSLQNLEIDSDQEWIEYSISIGSRVLDVPDFAALESAVWTTSESISKSA